jgi:tRNA A-37 threonylcarbamoyl transferase component Bud32
MRKHVWLWPLLTAALLAFVGMWVRGRMEGAMKLQLSANLQTILAANIEALRGWTSTMKAQAEIFAGDDRVGQLVAELARVPQAGGSVQAALVGAPQNAALRGLLRPIIGARGFDGYVVLDTNFLIIASGREQLIGLQSPPGYPEPLRPCLAGQSVVTHPFPSVALLPDANGQVRAGVPTMFSAAPIRATNGSIIAILGLRIVPERDFARILATARTGESGETYAVNRQGLMLSGSRFDEQLKRLALIPDQQAAQSILALELRDPLVDLSQGKASPKRRTELPLTRAAMKVVTGQEGFDVDGYRDYRGVPVVGAWTWLPDFDLGLVTELDVAEAFRPLRIMRLGFFFIFVLLILGAATIYILMRLANRLQDSARKAALKAKQLGQYALEDKIGAGAFGAVYRGRHALMRRPVAVKLLDPAHANETSIARFEREVQLTCQLTHPNTIALYDYGRTPEGMFYYAMEYLDGLNLDALVNKYGRLPEGRIIHILRQVCASLAEAHARGLVHRDIKPHNIFLTRRGDVPDFVKVLDFGLVKARNLANQLELTGANVSAGTPLYMSPEAVEHPDRVDAQSDLYSLGAVGYLLLTGETVFFGASIGEVLMQQVKAVPEKPSARLKEPVSADLEELILSCLAKKPADRPASARELEEALGRCAAAAQWDREQAEEWWRRFDAKNSERTAVLPQPQPAPA